MTNAIRSMPTIHSKCEQNIVKKFMYTLDDILDDSSKFQNGMFISFPQFLYCSHVHFQVWFFKGLGGTLHGHHTTVAMHHIHDITKPSMTLLLHYDITWPMVA